jgi:hypothetical protein
MTRDTVILRQRMRPDKSVQVKPPLKDKHSDIFKKRKFNCQLSTDRF